MSERPMTVKDFDRLKPRDFTNGAVLDEIHSALKQREQLLRCIYELDIEMDGVNCPGSAAAILNRFRSILKEEEVARNE